MPLDVEAVVTDPIEADEGGVELLAEVFRESGAIALDEAIAGALPLALDVDAVVELGWADGGQEPRLQDLVDEPLAGGGDARFLGLGLSALSGHRYTVGNQRRRLSTPSSRQSQPKS
jgi:hypothetical protein